MFLKPFDQKISSRDCHRVTRPYPFVYLKRFTMSRQCQRFENWKRELGIERYGMNLRIPAKVLVDVPLPKISFHLARLASSDSRSETSLGITASNLAKHRGAPDIGKFNDGFWLPLHELTHGPRNSPTRLSRVEVMKDEAASG